MTDENITAIRRASRADLAAAWYVHLCPRKDGTPMTVDPEARAAILEAMRAQGLTTRDMAMAAHAGGLIGDEQLAMLRGRG